jgi:hypothetical protein
MLIVDFNLKLSPARARPPRLQPRRVLGIAATLILHTVVLLYLLLPTSAMRFDRRAESAAATMSLVLIEPDTPAIPSRPATSATPATPRPPAARPSTTRTAEIVAPRRKPIETRAEAAPAAMSAEFIEPRITVADLTDDIEAAAAEIVAKDPRLPNAGMPSALGKVPGRAEEFVHLPLKHREGGALKNMLEAIGKHMIVGGLPDSPLQEMHNRAHRGGGEPVCNDPENPLADERCWLPPED